MFFEKTVFFRWFDHRRRLAIPESYEACENELFVGMFLLNAGSFLVHAHGVITHC